MTGNQARNHPVRNSLSHERRFEAPRANHHRSLKVRHEAIAALGGVFIVAVPLNFAWEMAQAFLYAPMGTFWEATWRCFVASLGDGVMLLIVTMTGAVLFGTAEWFISSRPLRSIFAAGAAFALAAIVEWVGLRTGRWEYDPRMVTVPGTQLGIVPLAQMVVLAPLTFRIAGLWLQRTRLARGGTR